MTKRFSACSHFIFLAFLLGLLLLNIGCVSSKQSVAGPPKPVLPEDNRSLVFAGFTISGVQSDLDRNFKYTTKVSESQSKDGVGLIDKAVREFFVDNRDALRNELLFEDGKSQNHPQLSLSLTSESIAQDQIAGNYKLTMDFIFQILIIDFKSKEVMATYPFRIERSETKKASDGSFTEDEIVELTQKIYDGSEPIMYDLLKERLKDVRLSSRLGSNIRVYKVNFADRCKIDLPKDFLEEGEIPKAYVNLTAQKLALFTQAELGVAVLPYAKDKANSEMALKFSDQSVVNFNIPDATYGIDLDVQGFKKVHDKAKSNTARDWWLYGSFIRIKVYDPDFGDEYYSIEVKPTKGKDLAGTWITKNIKVDESALFNVGLEKIILTGLLEMRNDKKAEEFISKSRN